MHVYRLLVKTALFGKEMKAMQLKFRWLHVTYIIKN